jgi:hypothetical protein
MSKVLERATAHFRDKINEKMKFIEVPEWDCKIYFKNSVTLKEQSKLIELATSGKTVEALVETLIVKARNEDGTKMFTMMDKNVFLHEIAPEVIIRVVSEINSVNDDVTQEDVEKN